MKKIILIAALLPLLSVAQTTSPSVVATAGWYASAGSVSLSQTVGEIALVQTFSQGTITLTQGFQQPEEITTGILDFKSAGATMNLFPNPVNDRFQLQFSFEQEGQLQYQVYDLLGHEMTELMQESYTSGTPQVTLSATPWPSGIYVVKAVFESHGQQLAQQSRFEVIH